MALTSPTSSVASDGACRKGLCAPFVAALFIFALLNTVAGAFSFGRAQPTDFPDLSWTGWAVKDFLGSPERPAVVFLGSSLVLVPVAGADADYLGKRLDGSRHHVSKYFEDAFARRTGSGLTTFNFALPGEMPSDAYLIEDFLLKGEKAPRVIVYGVGPRDFMDYTLPSPASTDPFRNLARFGDISPIACRVMTDWTSRFNYEIGRLVYLYGQKEDVATWFDRSAKTELAGLVPRPDSGISFTVDDRRRLLPDYKSCQLGAGEAFFRPTTASERTSFMDNLDEYRKRYKRVPWATYVGQMEFLADLMDVARQRGTHVVLVTMPITDVNLALIKPYAYKTYRANVKALARAKGASFVDLQASGAFGQSDFSDTVHLHSGGGKKFLDLLVKSLAGDGLVRAALALPADRPSRSDGKQAHSEDTTTVPMAGLKQNSI